MGRALIPFCQKGPKGPEPGEMLHLPILSDIGVTDFKGHSLGFGDVSDPHVSVGGIISGPGPPDPELGDTLRLPDFLVDIDPGPGEAFSSSGSMLVRRVILETYVIQLSLSVGHFACITKIKAM